MVEKSSAKPAKPFPQISAIGNQFKARIHSLNDVMEENAQRLFGHALEEPEVAGQDRCEPCGEISHVQVTMSEIDDALIMLENKISNFMSEI